MSLFFCLSFRFGEMQMYVFEVVDRTCSSESYYFVELLVLNSLYYSVYKKNRSSFGCHVKTNYKQFSRVPSQFLIYLGCKKHSLTFSYKKS